LKVQIYIAHSDDVEVCVSAGVDIIGVVADPGMQTPSSLDFNSVIEVFGKIPDHVIKVALSMDTSTDAFLQTVEVVRPDILHVACSLSELSEELLSTLCSQTGDTQIMLAISMNTEDSIENAKKFEPFVDYFILDTSDPERVDVGATGKTHDWSLSANLVRSVNKPVVLAGGLSYTNVAHAIHTVNPWGVDSFSHTNLEGSIRKDPDKVRAFVKAAQN
jgi:phosphoribosylanthranilate isomerase